MRLTRILRKTGVGQGAAMDWARILAYVTGTVDQELLARSEYLVAENRILKAQLNGQLKLSDADRIAQAGEPTAAAAWKQADVDQARHPSEEIRPARPKSPRAKAKVKPGRTIDRGR